MTGYLNSFCYCLKALLVAICGKYYHLFYPKASMALEKEVWDFFCKKVKSRTYRSHLAESHCSYLK